MTKDELLSSERIEDLFDGEDDVEIQQNIIKAREQAKKFRCTKEFDSLVSAHKKLLREFRKQDREAAIKQSLEGWTNYETDRYPNMMCGAWIATQDGVRTPSNDYTQGLVACYHPILPIERTHNMEDGTEKVKIAFKRKGHWKEITVPREIIASASKIISLADFGVSVTSENAKLLVRFLSDVENLNDNEIEVQQSSSKLGWHEKGKVFLPYDSGITCDVVEDFRDLSGSIRQEGCFDVWREHVVELRMSGNIAVRLALAASFASVFVEPLNALPFVIDFWGTSGSGKTVLLMLAASVWACPEENQYIGNFDQTIAGMEVKADFLHSFPVILDDTSNAPRWTRDEFERLVYMITSGKGKTRSNKRLGQQRVRRWQNCTLTSGEKPLSGFATQGGAINRIVEVYCHGDVFEAPRETLAIILANYGYAGKIFIEAIRTMANDTLKERFNEYITQLSDKDKTAKQSAAMALILLADEIATKVIFKDEKALTVSEVEDFLVSQNAMSDDVRCYEMLMDKIQQNAFRFNPDNQTEQWGLIDKNKEFALFFPTAIKKICEDEGFSFKSFANWAAENDVILTENGRMTKVKKINGVSIRMYWVRIGDGFIHLDDDDDEPLDVPF